MSKRNIILASIGGALILIIAIVLIYKKNQVATPVTPGVSDDAPFGALSDNASTSVQSSSPVNFGVSTKGVPALVKLSDAPTAGGIAFLQNKSPAIRFVEKATGHIFDYSLRTSIIAEVSTTNVPSIAESLWSANALNAVLQYVDKDNAVNTYVGSLAPNQKTSGLSTIELKGQLLPDGVTAVAISPSGTKIFYLLPTVNGVDGYVATISGTKPTKIFSSALTEFLVSWPEEGTLLLNTKPAANVPGFVYKLNPSTGTLSQLLGGINGLVAIMNPAGTQIAYTDDTNALSILTLQTGKVTNTSVQTFAEKCIWSRKQKSILFCAVPTSLTQDNYPDRWYQGLVSFRDNIMKLDTSSNNTTIIATPYQSYSQSIDATNLVLSPGEDYLVFTNKKDYTLWSLTLQ